MATYGEFSSLLQLGVGVGIGLSLFKAPIDIRTGKLERTLDSEILALRGVTTDFGKRKRRDLLTLRLQFSESRGILRRLQIPFMVAAVAGAAINLLFLVKASVDATSSMGTEMAFFLIFISTAYFVLILIGLEILARYFLSGHLSELYRIQTAQGT